MRSSHSAATLKIRRPFQDIISRDPDKVYRSPRSGGDDGRGVWEGEGEGKGRRKDHPGWN